MSTFSFKNNLFFQKGHPPTKFRNDDNWEKRICEICGKEFEKLKRLKNSRFCSNKCRLKFFSNFSKLERKRRKNSERQKRKWMNGEFSEKSIEKMRKANLGKKNLHTKEGLERLRQQRIGKNNPMYGRKGALHPNWKDGKSFEKYPEEFTEELKEEIRKRDSYKCRKCNKNQRQELSEFKCKLAIHHIDYDKKNNEKNNLITLCKRCNSIASYNKSKWMSYFINAELKIYKKKREKNG